MDDLILLINRVLGRNVTSFDIELDGASWHGWRSSQLWPRADYASNALVDRWWPEFSRHNARLFLGPYTEYPSYSNPMENWRWMEEHENDLLHPIFAFLNMPAPTIVEFVQAGNYSCFGQGGDWRPVKRALETVFQHCPFEVTLANWFSVHGYFLRKVDDPLAKIISPILYEASIQGSGYMHDLLRGKGMGLPTRPPGRSAKDHFTAVISRYIQSEQSFRLIFS